MMTRKIYIILVMLLVAAVSAQAKVSVPVEDQLELRFAVGSSTIDSKLFDNASQLSKVESMAQRFAQADESQRYIVINSYASPEGNEASNSRLAQSRSQAMVQLLRDKVGQDAHYVVHSNTYDWDYLYQIVNEDFSTPQRDEVLELLSSYVGIAPTDIQSKELHQQLKELGHGRSYAYMKQNLFPKMRRVVLEIRYPGQQRKTALTQTEKKWASGTKTTKTEWVVVSRDTIRDTIYSNPTYHPIDRIEHVENIEIKKEKEPKEEIKKPVSLKKASPLYLSLKTNMLFDLASVANISSEWSFAPKWSVNAEYMHALWKSDRTKKYGRTYSGNLELRYWFGRKAAEKRLTGHHIGVYAGALTYDFEWGGKGYQAKKWSTNFGLSYGYAVPIAKRLNLDFELGVGYFSGEYEEYVPQGDAYFWESTKSRKFIGPTRLEATLVWLLGRGNVNKK